jgi:NodT family efflux transporter outer membrane factor (OMF) lipoprotein
MFTSAIKTAGCKEQQMKFANIYRIIGQAVPICLWALCILSSIGLCLMVGGCSVGPKYQRPAMPLAPSYKELGNWQQAGPKDTIVRDQWWGVFQDAQLNDLERRVDRGNQTIAAAAANYEAARALVREARSQYFPTLTTSPAITNSRVSTIAIPGITSKGYTDTVYDLPFTASWEPDLWGRIRKTVQANVNAAQGSAADLENARLLMHANLAADYFDLRGVEQQERLLGATVIAWSRYLDLTRGLLRSGLDADEAVAAAESQLEAAQAQRTNLGIARAQYEHAIAILLGESPSSFSIASASNDAHLPTVPAGLPAELLERRPDIAAAERAMAGANAQIGIAKAAYFPNVLLGATGGLESLSFADWFTWPSRFWSVGPSVAETLFDAGLRRATVRQYQAQYDETVANYRQTVLTAFGQVEDNLAAQRILVQDLQQQDAAVQSAQRYVKQATARNHSGLDPYLNVLTAQVNLLTYRQTYVTFQTQQMLASVQLIEALGGGWDAAQLPGSKDISAKTAPHLP